MIILMNSIKLERRSETIRIILIKNLQQFVTMRVPRLLEITHLLQTS